MIDFDGLRAELLCAITALNNAKELLADDHTDKSVYARVDISRIITDLGHGIQSLNRTERILKGDN